MMDYTLHCGDCLDIVTAMPDATYSAVFCDPPYGINFMNRSWDHGVPSVAVWEQVHRVCKPGAILMAFGGTRTWHRLAVNIENAGWEMFDTIMYVYGSGFPKSHDISKAIDKAAGAEREVIGQTVYADGKVRPKGWSNEDGSHEGYRRPSHKDYTPSLITAPATPDAATWHGYGTALKPAYEPVLCFRKPLEATYAHSALTYGTGAINIDGCRVGTNGADKEKHLAEWNRLQSKSAEQGKNAMNGGLMSIDLNGYAKDGRWPANLIHDGSDEVMVMFPETKGDLSNRKPRTGKGNSGNCYGFYERQEFDKVRSDTGSAARFFYCAKASSSERNAGLEGMPLADASVGDRRPSGSMSQRIHKDEGRPETVSQNHHPTVKPLALTEYLARLIVPPEAYRDDAKILIPYAGVGSEAIGAMRAGWRNITGIELEAEYCDINRRRFDHWTQPQAQTMQPTLLEVA